MIGDNLETDILFGINANIDSFLVLTGVTDQALLDKNIKENHIIPNYYSEYLWKKKFNLYYIMNIKKFNYNKQIILFIYFYINLH